MRTKLILAVLAVLFSVRITNGQTQNISSPNKQLLVELFNNPDGTLSYSVKRKGKLVLASSDLGLITNTTSFKSIAFVSASKITAVNDKYSLLHGKKANVIYKANKRTFTYANEAKKKIDIVFQVSDDAVAFKYLLADQAGLGKEIADELTTFNFPEKTKTWLQPMQVSKTGWEQTNPAYEEHYNVAVDVAKVIDYKTGWVYPALYQTENTYSLVTEAGLDGTYCATRLLSSPSKPGNFKIGFPDPREIFPGKALLPQITFPFASPWRVIAIGDLKTVVESTAGTDLAKPSQLKDLSYIKPGNSSWSWINSKDDFIIYKEQKKYIDFAADMNWQYCLIDVNWDKNIGYEKMKELADYAKTKNVGLLLWYNSAGDWNTVKYTPKNLLTTQQSRVKEFARLQEMGIKGVKIDFFGGDGQSVIQYYVDILNDAANAGLMVNFHGATLPRGWARTYPNLLTAEAVRGYENVTFTQKDADKEAEFCTVLPYARNAFDPMDYTPMNLYKNPSNVQRKTSGAFQLALSVLFTSGLQHFAESPEGMAKIPENVQAYVKSIPTKWDDVKFIDGIPGEFAVIVRKAGSKWYVGGITNKSAQKINLNLAQFAGKNATLYLDGKEKYAWDVKAIPAKENLNFTIEPSSGFVVVVE